MIQPTTTGEHMDKEQLVEKVVLMYLPRNAVVEAVGRNDQSHPTFGMLNAYTYRTKPGEDPVAYLHNQVVKGLQIAGEHRVLGVFVHGLKLKEDKSWEMYLSKVLHVPSTKRK